MKHKHCLKDVTDFLVMVFGSLLLIALSMSVHGQNQQEHPEPRDQNQEKQQGQGSLPELDNGEFHQEFELSEQPVISSDTLHDCCEVINGGFASIATGTGLWYDGPTQEEATSGGSKTGTVCEDEDEDPCDCNLSLSAWHQPTPCSGDTVQLEANIVTRGDCEDLDCMIKIYRSGDKLIEKGKPTGKGQGYERSPGSAGSLVTKHKLKGGEVTFGAITTGCPCGYDFATVEVPPQRECCGDCESQTKTVKTRFSGPHGEREIGTLKAKLNYKCTDVGLLNYSVSLDDISMESLFNVLFEISSLSIGDYGINTTRVRALVKKKPEKRSEEDCRCGGKRVKKTFIFDIKVKLQMKLLTLGNVEVVDWKTIKSNKVLTQTIKTSTICCRNCDN